MQNGSPTLIRLNHPERSLDARLREAKGGFAWWYMDLLTDEGDGMVLIWSFGLPFLPGYQDAARRGAADGAGARPSLYLATYRGGKEQFYLFQEHAEADGGWDPDRHVFRFGNSRITSLQRDGRRYVWADLDCALPGTDQRLRGEVWLDGVARRDEEVAEATDLNAHDWSPLTGPARGGAELRVGAKTIRVEGRAYHDRNGSAVHLDGHGIEHWVWGRVAAAGSELIYYVLYPTQGTPTVLAMEVLEDGRTRHLRDVSVELHGARLARYGMPYWSHVRLLRSGRPWLIVRHRRLVDDGPFYLRFFTEAELGYRAGGRPQPGSGELLRPGRVDLPVWRPLVRMKVHQTSLGNSPFVPLFSGPKAGRLARLLGTLRPSRPERFGPRLGTPHV